MTPPPQREQTFSSQHQCHWWCSHFIDDRDVKLILVRFPCINKMIRRGQTISSRSFLSHNNGLGHMPILCGSLQKNCEFFLLWLPLFGLDCASGYFRMNDSHTTRLKSRTSEWSYMENCDVYQWDKPQNDWDVFFPHCDHILMGYPSHRQN